MSRIGVDIEFAKKTLKRGKLVAIPTETVYGLAANAYDLEAVASIFEAKNRPFFDPLILHCPNKESAFSLFKEYPEEFNKLADALWPGPLTLAAPKTEKIPDLITAGSPIVAVRVPSHPFTLNLLESIDFPLAAPSANPFGYISPTTAGHVSIQLGDKIDYILDGGRCQIGIESTIIGYKDNKVQVWRLGGVSIEKIESIIGKEVEYQISKNSKPESSGQLDKHYSPNTKILLLSEEELVVYNSKLSLTEKEDTALLIFGKQQNYNDFGKVYNLSLKADYNEAAHNLYAFLRQMDLEDYKKILAVRLPNIGLGRAINDRLQRAAAK